MTTENIAIIRTKIIEGLELTYQKLLIAKRKEDGEFIFSIDGKIVRMKAREIKDK